MTRSVAFATYRPEITGDDLLAADVLRRQGVHVWPVVWDAEGVSWSDFDAVIIRSTWDYHLKRSAYERWLSGFRAGGPPLWNPADVVLTNVHKKYLCALAEKGVAVVPTVCRTAREGPGLRELLERENGWGEVVVKPAVSAGALGVWRTSVAQASRDELRFAEQSATQDLLVQPYFPQIASAGEWSLIFFDGRYSHAALKRPRAGDFRVQERYGGKAIAATPPEYLIRQAEAVLAAVEQPLLYARVDGIDCDGQLVLMELEITEPLLFLGLSPHAPRRFAEAILHVLNRPAG